ncbi:MAG: hypothetical protein GXP63_02375 [DPANN group archaeon]|nr:hypothetical protein [DPANN group archaeon]
MLEIENLDIETGWYFLDKTSGALIGPYGTREAAQEGLERYEEALKDYFQQIAGKEE